MHEIRCEIIAPKWRGRSELDVAHRRPNAARLDLACETLLDIDHAHYHSAAGIEGQVLKSPSRIEAPHVVIKRMGDDAHAADAFGGGKSRHEREQEEGPGMPLSLIVLVHRELTEKRDGYGIREVALLRSGEKCALDLRGA